MFTVFSKIIFSDASSTGFAGYQVAMLNDVSHGMLISQSRYVMVK